MGIGLAIFAGVIATWLGFFLGLVTKYQFKKRTAEDTKPICFCSHHFGEHRKNGTCGSEIRRIKSGGGFNWVACPCMQYIGPLPLENHSLWVAPIATTPAAIQTIYGD